MFSIALFQKEANTLLENSQVFIQVNIFFYRFRLENAGEPPGVASCYCTCVILLSSGEESRRGWGNQIKGLLFISFDSAFF